MGGMLNVNGEDADIVGTLTIKEFRDYLNNHPDDVGETVEVITNDDGVIVGVAMAAELKTKVYAWTQAQKDREGK